MDDLLKLKHTKELQDLIRGNKNFIRMNTDSVCTVDELKEEHKGIWVEHDESDFHKMFQGLLDYCADEECYTTLDWDTVNYEVYGADWYEQKFPGFSEEVYEVLAKSTEDKLVDERIPPLKYIEKEVTLSFS